MPLFGRKRDEIVEPETSTPEAEEASVGLYGKFHVERTDGRDRPEGAKENARYFVLDYVHDPAARRALYAYAKKLEALGTEPELAQDLYRELDETEELFQRHGKQ